MIITSMLDNDLYKFTQMKAVKETFPSAEVEYIFHNRRKTGKFNKTFLTRFFAELDTMQDLRVRTHEMDFLERKLPFLGKEFLLNIANFRFDPRQIKTDVINGELELSIKGLWHKTILWEVPLMALISELYFQECDTNWDTMYSGQDEYNKNNAKILEGIKFADFGTRRRRSKENQDFHIAKFKQRCSTFVGTSNVHFARKYDLTPIGTMAHEWIMGVSSLVGLRHANKYAMKLWSDIYGSNLGIALTDTFGSEAFFKDFIAQANLFSGLRQDSGDPFVFADRAIAFYEASGIQPLTKTIIFSDSLNAAKARKLHEYCANRIGCSFGIGTEFTNHFENSPPLNMVIKLSKCDGVPVVKLSDDPEKAIGDPDAVRVAKWTFFKKPL